MTEGKISNEDMFECKMYITDLETNKKSKEINVSDLVFNDYIEFEFGNYEDEDYGALPYKDFKFFINDYSVTFYSPQYHKALQELDKYKNIVDEVLESVCCIEHNLDKYEEIGLDHLEYAQNKIAELKEYLRELKGE